VESFSAYDINFIDTEPSLLRSERFVERNNKTNEVLSAYKGYSVVSTKVYDKEYYSNESVRLNMDGSLNGSSAPIVFKKNDQRPVIGTAEIDGTEYYLVPSDLESFVHLVRDNGTIYKKMGQIRFGKLVLMGTEYVPYPDGLRFEPVMGTSTVQEKPVDGFDIKYNGINRGRLEFIYMTFGGDGNSGNFQTLPYANRRGAIDIHGTKINVINASDEKIDYTILE
jgi:hypothetical protein